MQASQRAQILVLILWAGQCDGEERRRHGKGVAGQIIKNCLSSIFAKYGETEQQITRMCDAGIGEQPFKVLLRQSA